MTNSKYVFLSVLSLFIFLSMLLHESKASQSDFKIINYGIIKDNRIVETTDSIPLKKNIYFGAEVSFPKNKYTSMIVKYEVPPEHECKPQPEGYTRNIKDKETYRAGWKIEKNCEMIPGNYVINFIVGNTLVASKEFNVEDFYYEFGIINNDKHREIIRHGNIVPLQKGMGFGAKLWFPYKKYKKITKIYKVPQEMSCKPKPEGYTNNLNSYDTSCLVSWRIENDCEMVPGQYQIIAFLDNDKKIDITFTIVLPESFYSKTSLSDNLPGGYYLIQLGMTKSEVIDVMKKHQFNRKGGFNEKLTFSRKSSIKKYDYLKNLEYRFNFRGRDDVLIVTHAFDHYPARWNLYKSKYANKFVFDLYGLSFYPSYHYSPNRDCKYPYYYAGDGSNMGFNNDSKLISFMAVLNIKDYYVKNYDFGNMFISKFKSKHGDPNGMSKIKNPGLVTYSTVDSWYDNEKLVSIWKRDSDTIYLLYRIIETTDLNDSFVEFETIGDKMMNDCLREQEEHIEKTIKLE